jgi:hypothetical protein
LSPFSATIVQNSSNLRNDWDFATTGDPHGANQLFAAISNRKSRENAGRLWYARTTASGADLKYRSSAIRRDEYRPDFISGQICQAGIVKAFSRYPALQSGTS